MTPLAPELGGGDRTRQSPEDRLPATYAAVIFHGKGGELATNRRDEQEISVLSAVIAGLSWGWRCR